MRKARGVDVSKAWRTEKCRARYSEFIKNSFDPDKAILGDSQVELDVEVGDLGERAFERELALPEFQELFAGDEDDLRGVDEHDYESGTSSKVSKELSIVFRKVSRLNNLCPHREQAKMQTMI